MKLENCLKKSNLSGDVQAGIKLAVKNRAEGQTRTAAAVVYAEQQVEALKKDRAGYLRVLEQAYDKAYPGVREKAIAKKRAPVGKQRRTTNAYDNVASKVVKVLENKKAITSKMLFDAADKAYGGSQAEGAYTVKQAYDALELGVNQYLLRNLQLAVIDNGEVRQATPQEVIRDLKEVMERLPTQSKRTAEMDEFQQFSTPPPLAYIANWVASVQKGDQYLEPSAGVGGLAVFGRMTNAGQIVVNEIGENRKQLLHSLPFNTYIGEDAAQIGNMRNAEHMKDIRPDTVVMNPPFSATAGRRQGRRNTMEGAQHVEQALAIMKDGGRLVAVTGKGMAMDKPAFTAWWNKIKKKYNVRANVRVSGKEYRKYGTTFDNQLIVIDKTGPTVDAVITGAVESTEALIPILQEVKDARVTKGQQRPSQPTGSQEAAGTGTGRPQREQAVRPATDEPGATQEQGGTALASGQPAAPGRRPDQRQRPGSGQPVATGQLRPDDGDRQPPESGSGGRDTTGTPADETGERATGLSVVEKKQERRKGEISDSLYEGYSPERITIKGAQRHPTPLVQSAAMSAVTPPKINYIPSLPHRTIKGNKKTGQGLSDIQIESVMYAGQAHDQTLPDGSRMGYFIGDGTGVGKGREIAAIMLDNWNKGRKKHVWLSEKASLFKDAQRDVQNVMWDKNLVFSLSKTKINAPVKTKQGILFTTYDTLKSVKRDPENPAARLDQIVEWLGPDFDGVIAFDESHNMGNAVSVQGARGRTRPAQKALIGIELQNRMPNARVVYVSATGATEVINLAYAQRLGLWGEGMPFASNIEFVNQIRNGGIAAMEMVAQDLKSMGKYTARSLSYDGVKYDRIVHDLTDDQVEQYNTMAEAWQIVLRNINDALEETGGARDGRARGQAMGQFWGAHQRFFNQIMTSMSLPSVVAKMKKDLADGKSVVIQLTSTYEAALKRGLGRLTEEDSLDDLDLSPFDDLMNYVTRSFPVAQYETYTDDSGNDAQRIATDSNGNVIQNADAVALREDLLNQLGGMRGQVADGPLDAIIDVFGPDLVAEVTGRKQRVIMADTDKGRQRIVEKRSDAKAAADAVAFMNGKKRVLIFSEKGGTGLSYHSDLAAKNQQVRAHYLLQAGWRADKAVQGLGRTHRSNQAQPPEYWLVTTNLDGQKRFISSIARRLDQLGALTKGSSKTGSQGIFGDKDNLESEHAREGLEQFFYDLYLGDIPDLSLGEFQRQTGLDLLSNTGNLSGDLPDITQFLNRLLSLPVDMQSLVFGHFEQRLDSAFNRRMEAGTLNVGVETLVAQKIEKASEEVVYTHSSGAKTRYIQLDVTHPNKRRPFSAVSGSDMFIQNRRSSQVWAVKTENKVDTETGARVKKYHLGGPAYTSQVHAQDAAEAKLENGDWIELTQNQAKGLWEAQYNELPETITYKEHILSGLLLPIWDRLRGHPRLYRVQTDEGEQFIGRRINEQDLNQTLTNLGVGAVQFDMEPDQVFTNVYHNNYTIKLSNGWEIVRRRVSGDNRIELKNIEYADYRLLERHGLFIERINFQTRYFIPVEKEQAVEAIKGVMVNRQIVEAQPPVSSRYNTRLAKGKKTFDPRRALNATDVGNIQETADLVVEALRFAGLSRKEIDRIKLELKPIIDLRGKDVQASVDQWVAAKKDVDAILGATTMDGMQALMELSLEQDMRTMERTAYHESFHVMAQWVLPESEYNRVMKFYGNNEEIAAEAFADYIAGVKSQQKRPAGMVRRIFARIKKLLERLGNTLRGKGFMRPEDIFEGLRSGQYEGGRAGTDATSISMMAEESQPGGKAKFFKPAPDSAAVDIESFANLLETEAFTSKGLGGLDAPGKRQVMDSVVALAHNPEIFNSIVEFIPVDVVNNLIRTEPSAKVALHDGAMLERLLTVDSKGAIPIATDIADPLIRSVAALAAKTGTTFMGSGTVKKLLAVAAPYTDTVPLENAAAPVGAKESAGFPDLVGLPKNRRTAVGTFDFYQETASYGVDKIEKSLQSISNQGINSKKDLAVALSTPQMREKALTEGMTMFNRGELEKTASQYADQYNPADPSGAGKPASSYSWKQVAAYPVSKFEGHSDWESWFKSEQKMWAEEGQPDRFQEMLDEKIVEPVIAVEIGGTAYLWDGNHRVAAAITSGQKTVPAIIGTAKTKTDTPSFNRGTFDPNNPDIRLRMGKKPPKPPEPPNVIDKALPPKPAKRYQAAKITKDPLLKRIGDFFKTAYSTFKPGNAFPTITGKGFAKAREILRNVLAVNNYSKWKAAAQIRTILKPSKMTKDQYDLFGLSIAMDDMLADIENEDGALADWEVKHGELPFGFETVEQVRESIDRINEMVAADSFVEEALANRQAFMRDMRDKLVRAKLLPESVKKDPRYFHHQVLKYANDKRRFGMGTGQKDVRVHKKGYQMHRIGSIEDYNTDYLQAEYEVLAHGYAQLATQKNQEEIDREYNIIDTLREKARKANYVAVVGGPEKWQELQRLLGQREELRQARPMDSGTKQQVKALTERIWELDPTMPFRAKIAAGFSNLAKTGAPEGSRYNEEIDLDEFEMSDLARLADNDNVHALSIFKAIRERQQFMKTALGPQFATYQTMMATHPPVEGSDGWVEWAPKLGNAFYLTNSLTDKLLEQTLAGVRELQESDFKKVLALRRQQQWVLPAELAAAMNGEDFTKRGQENVVGRLSESMLNNWKRWILINPMRLIKYNLNNLSGDLDITLAYNYRILKNFRQSAKDLYAFHYNKGMNDALKDEFDTLVRDDVITSGMTASDIPDVSNQADFDRLMTAVKGEKKSAIKYIKRFWEGSKNFTTWRENILRLAAYRHFKTEIAAGKKVYGVSEKAKVDATTDPNRKAALLARELVGDYGNLSKGGQYLRRKMIPFYSWMEINAPRYWRLFKNLPNEGEPNRRKVASAVMLGKGAVLTVKMSMMYAAINAFNHAVFPDEEEELGGYGRRQLHLIWGRREDGSIQTIRFQGAFSDALAWVGAEDLPEDLRELAKGKKSLSDWAIEAGMATPNKMINAIRPDIKTTAETLMGRTLYPDVTKPRVIRDKMENLTRMFSADPFYRRMMGRPSRERGVFGKVLGDMARTFTYSADPGEAAYQETRSMVYKYLEGQNIERSMADPTSKANALYYYRQAVKWGDLKAAYKYLTVYKDKGGTLKGLKMSIDRAHPLAALPKKHRLRFIMQLKRGDREIIKRGLNWYKMTYKDAVNG